MLYTSTMALLIEKYKYVPINRQQVNGKRLYATPDGRAVPSVTTILDKTKPAEARQALANWKKAVGEQEAQQITTEAANRGTRMHTYLENYIKGEALRESVSNPYAQQSLDMAKIVISNGFPRINEVWGSEVPLYFPGLYAGTTDCCGLHDGDESILDFKQTNKPKKEEWVEDYKMQLVAYILAHNEVYKTDIREGHVFMCSRGDDNMKIGGEVYQQFDLWPTEFNEYQDKWLAKVEDYYQNHYS